MASAAILDEEDADSMAALIERLGGISPKRILVRPSPGTATEADVLAAEQAPRKRLCELIDGTLVEKAMGFRESLIMMAIGYHLRHYLQRFDRGLLSGA